MHTSVSPSQVSREPVLDPLGAVSRKHGLEGLTEELDGLKAWLAEDLKSMRDVVDTILAKNETNEPLELQRRGRELISAASGHLLRQPGKGVRPISVLLAARVGPNYPHAVVRNLAVACELAHSATLLHDDVIDEGRERRGAPTSRVVYGNAVSILAGDHLLLSALQLVEETGHWSLVSSFIRVIRHMVIAEAMQLERRETFIPNQKDYWAIIDGKTAALFEWGLRAGALASGLSVEHQSRLARIGMIMGRAFQLVDDVLDLEGDSRVTGKDTLVDVREGKLTWPLILTAERVPGFTDRLRELVLKDATQQSVDAMAACIDDIRSCDALVDTRKRAAEEATRAVREVMGLPSSPATVALRTVIESVVDRHA